MPFLRQLYKQKPQIYGPVSSVQASIFKNAERIGIDHAVFEAFFTAWPDNPDTFRNILSEKHFTKTYGQPEYKNNSLYLTDNGNNVNNDIMVATGLRFGTPGINTTWIFNITPELTASTYARFVFGVGSSSTFTIDNSSGQMTFDVSMSARGYRSSFSGLNFNTLNQVGISINWPVAGSACVGGYGIINGLNQSLAYRGADLTQEYVDTEWESVRFGYGSHINYYGYTGYIHSVFKVNCLLTDSQIAYLYDNPYFLLHRVPTVFYSVPGGAITIKTVTDTGSGLDGIVQISNILSVSDSGSGFDVFAGLAAGISVVDVGSGTDAVQPAASVTVQDTGVAIELIQQISAACSVADTGTGADNIGRILASLFVSDTGAGSDVITVLKELLKTVTDSGTGTDSISRILASLFVSDTGSSTDIISQILAGVSVSDTGTGVDFIALLKDILKTISDTGSGSDSVSIQPVSVSVQDAGTALDIIGHIAVALSVSDAGTIAEIISTIKTKMVTVTDTGTVSDSAPTISVSLTVSDTAAALDLVGQVINSLTVSDTGYGLERITKTDFNILPSGKVTVTFTIKTPGASFAMRTPKATFNIE